MVGCIIVMNTGQNSSLMRKYQKLLNPKTENSDLCKNVPYCFTLNPGLQSFLQLCFCCV